MSMMTPSFFMNILHVEYVLRGHAWLHYIAAARSVIICCFNQVNLASSTLTTMYTSVFTLNHL
jgi:hypothetical protein